MPDVLAQSTQDRQSQIDAWNNLSLAEKGAIAQKEMEVEQQAKLAQSQNLRATAEQQLGAPLAEETSPRISGAAEWMPFTGETKPRLSEFQNPSARFDIGRSRTTEGMVSKLQSDFPQLEIKTFTAPSGQSLVALRKPGESNFTLLDSPELTTFSDIAQSGGSILNAETAASVASAIATRGSGFLVRAGAMALSSAAGRSADTAFEDARGYEKFSFDQMKSDAVSAGMLGLLGETAGTVLGRGVSAVLGGGMVSLTPEERAAAAAATRSGMPGIEAADVHPVLRRIQTQSATVSKTAQVHQMDQLGSALDNIKALSAKIPDRGGLSDREVVDLSQQANDSLLRVFNNLPPDPQAAGEALQTGLAAYRKIQSQALGREYNAAFAASPEMGYDISGAKKSAATYIKGVVAEGGIDVQGPMPANLKAALSDLQKLPDKITPYNDTSAMEIVKTLRTRFFDLKTPAVPGKGDYWNKVAGNVWHDLTDVMENPAGGDPHAVELLKQAGAHNRQFETTLDIATIKKIAMSTEPDKLIQTVAQPYNGFALKTLKAILPEGQWETFRQKWVADLMQSPGSGIESTLNGFRKDPSALRTLVSQDEEGALRVLSIQKSRLESSFSSIVSKADADIRATALINNTGAQDITSMIDTWGGLASTNARKLQAGVLTRIIKDSTEMFRGRDIINPETFSSSIQSLDKEGKLSALFTPDLVSALRDRATVLSLFPPIASRDVGASIHGMTITNDLASAVGWFFNPPRAIAQVARGAEGLYKAWVWSHILISKTARYLVLGTGRGKLDATTLRAVSAVVAESTQETQSPEIK